LPRKKPLSAGAAPLRSAKTLASRWITLPTNFANRK
jgi:hypothetical protein